MIQVVYTVLFRLSSDNMEYARFCYVEHSFHSPLPLKSRWLGDMRTGGHTRGPEFESNSGSPVSLATSVRLPEVDWKEGHILGGQSTKNFLYLLKFNFW